MKGTYPRSAHEQLYSTHEDLQEQSRSQDMQIQVLLNQLDQLRTHDKVSQWTSRIQNEHAYRRHQSVVQEIGQYELGCMKTRS